MLGEGMVSFGAWSSLATSWRNWKSSPKILWSRLYATCASPGGPCTKVLDHPWLGSSDEGAGPGGAEFFLDGDGKPQMVFHAWHAGKVGYDVGGYRSVFTSGLALVDGRPVTTD